MRARKDKDKCKTRMEQGNEWSKTKGEEDVSRNDISFYFTQTQNEAEYFMIILAATRGVETKRNDHKTVLVT